MVVMMSMLMMYATISLLLSIIILIFSSWVLGFYFVVLFLFISLFYLMVLYPHEIWWHDNRDSFWSIIPKHIIFIILSIIIYSFIYYKFWLFIINWELSEISYYESLYFSVSMWVDLWYSYILPTKEIALISSLESINWYLYFAFIIAMISIWFNDVISSVKETTRHNRKIIEKQNIKEKKKILASKRKKWKQ